MRMTRKLRRAALLATTTTWPVTCGLNATNVDDWKKWDRYDH